MDIAKLLATFGPLGAFVYLLLQRVIYLAREYDVLAEDRDFWKKVALDSLRISEHNTETTARLVEKVKGDGG